MILFAAVTSYVCIPYQEHQNQKRHNDEASPDTSQKLGDLTSTIGNINTYTAYIGIIMGFAAALFSLEEKPLKLAWYYICMVISFLAMITGRSDNTYLSIGALFILLPFILFKDK